jgi:DNA-binding PadR family transcriptional regulator
MKKLVQTSISFFWTFPHAQLYREPQRLVQLGLLEEEQQEGGRRRRVFTLTEAGRAALDEWLASPGPFNVEIRDLALLKLFFGRLARDQDIAMLAAEQLAGHRRQQALYEQLLDRYAGRDELSHQLAPLRIGISYEQAYIDFWEEIAQRPYDPSGRQARKPRRPR